MFIVLSVLSGFLVTIMINFNGLLQTAVGGTTALLCIHVCGLLGALLFFLITGRRLKGESSRKPAFYCLLAGTIGATATFFQSISFQKGGILLSLSGSLAGQILAASVTESFYKGDRQKSPIFQRVIAPALLIPGSFIIGHKAGASFFWIILSWLPGIILMVQQTMNSKNTAYYGTPKTIIFNFTSALILITPLFLFSSGSDLISEHIVNKWTTLSTLPWYVVAGGGLIGVFSTGFIAFLLLKAPALVVSLGIYSGELFSGVLLDLFTGHSIAIEKIIGILLIVAGLGAGKINFKKEAIKE
ncbi:MAG: DMT family transporter [Spirochaetales bacterium]|nr:DMT family transporter [Spirochaetales bacterium]